jgi:EAL domain-containing protein (putative c-di-GMP-specific phosphodiesterase class I)
MISADMALYEAKARGGDHLATFDEGGAGRLMWIERISDAIERGDVVFESQPIVDLVSGEQVAEELLARLRDGDRLLLPKSWLAPAEASGLIGAIDRTAVTKAIELAAAGRTVSVNLSGRSVGDPGLTAAIGRGLADAEADPGKLIFEITETMTAAGADVLRDFGERIERLGCSLAIDDFGTGFGSFNYLRHLPTRYLKIDREFVQGAVSSTDDRALARLICLIADRFGMETIAEGIEDEETARLMIGAGARLGQGFHFGRPQPL